MIRLFYQNEQSVSTSSLTKHTAKTYTSPDQPSCSELCQLRSTARFVNLCVCKEFAWATRITFNAAAFYREILYIHL